MRLRSTPLSLGYKGLFILAAFLGLFLHSGLPHGKLRTNMFLYYTNLSNLLCLVLFVVLFLRLARTLRRGRSPAPLPAALAQLKGMATMGLLTTLLVYHAVLRPFILQNPALMQSSAALAEFGDLTAPGNLLVHYIVPCMAFLDWLLFDEKGRFQWYSPFLWSLALLAYGAFVLVHAALVGTIPGTKSRFPYPFLNVDALGWPAVLLGSAAILAAFLALGALYFGLDRLLARLAPAQKPQQPPPG